MIDVLPQMIKQESPMINEFFNSCLFRPLSVQGALIIKWPDNRAESEFIYASATTLITDKSLERVLIDADFLQLRDPVEVAEEDEEEKPNQSK